MNTIGVSLYLGSDYPQSNGYGKVEVLEGEKTSIIYNLLSAARLKPVFLGTE